MEHNLNLLLILIAVLGISVQWIAWQYKIPAIILLTIAGLIVGPGLGILNPSADFGHLLNPIIQLGVAVILFEGGLNLHLHELKEAGSGVKRMCSIGVVLSWALGSLGGYYIGDLSWPVSLIFGAIVVVTGPTVIIPLLRQAKLRRSTASLLKWEGIINDPTGALIAVLVFGYFVHAGSGEAVNQVIIGVTWTLLAGVILGAGVGFFLGYAFKQAFVPEFLKAPVILSAVMLVFGGANLLQEEAGLLSATVLGLVMGNQNLPSMNEMRRHKEYITIFLVSSLFILLTADLDPFLLKQLNWRSAALIAFIIFIARPATVLLSLWGSDVEIKERLLVAWIAPRGIVAAAVAGAFAPALVEKGFYDANQLVPLIFSLIVCTVVLHGLSIGWLARKLDLAFTKSNGLMIVGASPWSVNLAKVLQELDQSVIIVDSSWHRLRPARLAGIPVYFGQILSESAEQSIEFNQISYLLAATDNDSFNALVCTRFGPELGRSHVFQLPSIADVDPNGFSPSIRGHILGDEVFYEDLIRRYFFGWRFNKTRITEEYDYESCVANYQNDAMEIVVIKPDGTLYFRSAEKKHKPKAGDTVIVFQPEKQAFVDD
ncbi:MAG: cation:proton antiporter [Gammaproteobacteria bacterium]